VSFTPAPLKRTIIRRAASDAIAAKELGPGVVFGASCRHPPPPEDAAAKASSGASTLAAAARPPAPMRDAVSTCRRLIRADKTLLVSTFPVALAKAMNGKTNHNLGLRYDVNVHVVFQLYRESRFGILQENFQDVEVVIIVCSHGRGFVLSG